MTITDSQLARLDLVRMRLMVEAEHYLRGAAATDTSPELRSVLTGVYTALLGYVEMLKKIEEPKAVADADSELVMWDSSKQGNEGY